MGLRWYTCAYVLVCVCAVCVCKRSGVCDAVVVGLGWAAGVEEWGDVPVFERVHCGLH